MQICGSQRLGLTSQNLTILNPNACLSFGTHKCSSLLRTSSTGLGSTPSFPVQQSVFGRGFSNSGLMRLSTALVEARGTKQKGEAG